MPYPIPQNIGQVMPPGMLQLLQAKGQQEAAMAFRREMLERRERENLRQLGLAEIDQYPPPQYEWKGKVNPVELGRLIESGAPQEIAIDEKTGQTTISYGGKFKVTESLESAQRRMRANRVAALNEEIMANQVASFRQKATQGPFDEKDYVEEGWRIVNLEKAQGRFPQGPLNVQELGRASLEGDLEPSLYAMKGTQQEVSEYPGVAKFVLPLETTRARQTARAAEEVGRRMDRLRLEQLRQSVKEGRRVFSSGEVTTLTNQVASLEQDLLAIERGDKEITEATMIALRTVFDPANPEDAAYLEGLEKQAKLSQEQITEAKRRMEPLLKLARARLEYAKTEEGIYGGPVGGTPGGPGTGTPPAGAAPLPPERVKQFEEIYQHLAPDSPQAIYSAPWEDYRTMLGAEGSRALYRHMVRRWNDEHPEAPIGLIRDGMPVYPAALGGR